MLIAVILLSLLVLILLISFIYYRRQVLRLSRHVAFMNEHKTQLLAVNDINSSELNSLTEEINKLAKKANKISAEFHRKESEIKDTMANISHDIRTPLTSLDGYFQLLTSAETPEEQERYIKIIKSRIDSLNVMLEELFTYTKLQNESYEIEISPVNFSKTVFDTCFSFYDEFSARNIEPTIDFCSEQLYINANAEALQRTIQNIIKNAFVHGAKNVTFSLFEKDGKIQFICSNTVTDKDSIDLDRIFTRFYKADKARTRISSGLGLAIAHDFTLKMGGEIKAEMNGDVFSISIAFKKA